MENWLDRTMRPMAAALQHDDMARLGIANTMRLSKGWNRLRHGRLQSGLRAEYRERWDELIAENGAPQGRPSLLRDGWALDTTRSLPHLDRLLEEGAQVVAERGGKRLKDTGKLFIQDILAAEDLERFPAILDFALSSEVLTAVADYLKAVPLLSRTLAPGVRLTESRADYDRSDGPPKESQLFHLDHHDCPLVYVIVLLKDVTPQSGPFCFLPAAASARAAAALGYRRRGRPYRVTDEEMFAVIDPAEVQKLIYPRGTVLFIDSSRCFHYGSRLAIDPRYQMMYNFVSACRTDLSELFMPLRSYPRRDGASRLRRLVLRQERPR
jgi:hypothetical protein